MTTSLVPSNNVATRHTEVYSNGPEADAVGLDSAQRLNADEPPPGPMGDGYRANRTFDRTGQTNACPADPRQEDSRVMRFELATLRQPEVVVASSLLEARGARAARCEIAKGPMKILQGLLEGL